MTSLQAFDLSAIGRRTAPLLIIVGSDADPSARRQGGFRLGGNSDIYKLLPDGFAFDQLNLSKQFLKQAGRADPAGYQCVLNLVTDPDQHPKTLDRLGKLLRGHRGRVINPPDAVLRTTRDQVAKRLAGIPGLRVPRTLRQRNPRPGAAAAAAEREGLRYPLIVRLAGSHTGVIIGVIDAPAQLDAATAQPGDFILTEFVDFRSGDGLYRKYRMWSFGGTAIFRHMIVSDHWNVHVKQREGFMAGRPALIAEEMRLMQRTEGAFADTVHDAFAAVQKRIGLDFFGMDFGLDPRGEVVLFEANATMSFFPLERPPHFNYLAKLRQPAQAALTTMLFPSP